MTAGVRYRSISKVDELGVVRTGLLQTDVCNNSVSDSFIKHAASGTDVVSTSSVGILNHVYLCLDAATSVLSPELVSFPNESLFVNPQPATVPVQNHAFFCLDVLSCTILPTIVPLLPVMEDRSCFQSSQTNKRQPCQICSNCLCRRA